MGLAGTGLAALEDDYTRNSKYHGEDANTKHGCTGVRYLLVLAGVCITLVLVGIVALVGLVRAGTGLIATLARLRGALLNQTRNGIADCLSRALRQTGRPDSPISAFAVATAGIQHGQDSSVHFVRSTAAAASS